MIGEETVQVVSSSEDVLDYKAKEILDVDFKLKDVTDHLFTDKVVKQGKIKKKIVYIDKEGLIQCEYFETPFTVTAEIKGVKPELELDIQNKIVLSEIDFHLTRSHIVDIQIVFDIRIKASKWVQRRLSVCNTNIINIHQVTN